jgi:hypothetical protein
MKKNTLQILTSGLLLAGLFGCDGVSKNEYETLKTENEKLKQEIEDLKFGPDKLLAQAKLYIEKKEFSNSRTELQTLLDKYPASTQAIEAKLLINTVDKGIKEQELAIEKAKVEARKNEKERLSNATKKLNKKYDDVNEITWYRDKTSPVYVNYNGFYSYIGQSEGSKPWLRLAIQYAADDWLFIERYIIKVDGKTYTISEKSYGEIKTDNGSGGIWEWLDREVSTSEYEIIKEVAYGKEVKIRFVGKDYHKDKIIPQQQKTALKNVLDAYEVLGGDANL